MNSSTIITTSSTTCSDPYVTPTPCVAPPCAVGLETSPPSRVYSARRRQLRVQWQQQVSADERMMAISIALEFDPYSRRGKTWCAAHATGAERDACSRPRDACARPRDACARPRDACSRPRDACSLARVYCSLDPPSSVHARAESPLKSRARTRAFGALRNRAAGQLLHPQCARRVNCRIRLLPHSHA
eukprot:6040178-Pleurochrysis_carterae.AAC.5